MHNSYTDHFLLNPNVTFLNFGSFGSTVKPVFQKYHDLQLELEQEPVQFITVKGLQYLKESREALAKYINCNEDDVVYVTNPSYAVNAIAKSFDLKEGDEVLTTDIEYGACDKTWEYYCEKAKAKYIRAKTNFPLTSIDEFVENFCKQITPKTKLIFISHITSSTALRLPVEKICDYAKTLGITTFVDGAHAPAQIEIDLQNSNIDIYTGACHKWMMTPKGSSFLYVKKELQHWVDPLIVSWGYKSFMPSHSQFLDYHQLNGTRDYTAFLTIPTAIKFMEENNWTKVASNCRELVQANAHKLCSILGTKSLMPINNEFLVQMFSAEIKTTEPEKLKALLYSNYKIEIPVFRHFNKTFIRYSIQAFNTQTDLDNLFNALVDIKKTSSIIE